MASAARLDDIEFEAGSEVEQDPTPTPVFELPVSQPFFGGNRRFLPRVKGRFSGRLNGELLRGIDLSVRGMLCLGEEIIWPGNAVDVEVDLADEQSPVRCTATVVELISYRGELAMRVRFEDLDQEGRSRVGGWMARTSGTRRRG